MTVYQVSKTSICYKLKVYNYLYIIFDFKLLIIGSLYEKTTKQTGPHSKYNCGDLFLHLYITFIFVGTSVRFGFESNKKKKDFKQLLSSTEVV